MRAWFSNFLKIDVHRLSFAFPSLLCCVSYWAAVKVPISNFQWILWFYISMQALFKQQRPEALKARKVQQQPFFQKYQPIISELRFHSIDTVNGKSRYYHNRLLYVLNSICKFFFPTRINFKNIVPNFCRDLCKYLVAHHHFSLALLTISSTYHSRHPDFNLKSWSSNVAMQACCNRKLSNIKIYFEYVHNKVCSIVH